MYVSLCFRCHNLTSVTSALLKVLPNYFATYVPITTVMVVNPIMYLLLSKDIEMAVALPLAQVNIPVFIIINDYYLTWLRIYH